jgi:hypothetical protein
VAVLDDFWDAARSGPDPADMKIKVARMTINPM